MDETTGHASLRRPGVVPDLAAGADTDGDALPDTVLATDGTDLLVQTDLDVDGVVDRVLRIGVDGAVRTEGPPVEADGPVAGRAAAVWPGLLGRLLGPDP